MKLKKLLVAVTMVGMLGVAGTAYAAVNKSPADIVAGITGKSVTEVNQERAAGKPYGAIAQEAGKLEEFQVQMLEQKKTILDQRVQAGQLTQAQANQILAAIKNNQTLCDGTGNGMGKMQGLRMGSGAGLGRGRGIGSSFGNGCDLGVNP
jgi:hypothetical protein